MVFFFSFEVTVKEGGPRMIVTGYASGMVECRWYDGFGVKREAFHEYELVAVDCVKKPDDKTPGGCRAFS